MTLYSTSHLVTLDTIKDILLDQSGEQVQGTVWGMLFDSIRIKGREDLMYTLKDVLEDFDEDL